MDTLIAFAFFAAIGIFFAYKFAALFLAQTDMLYSDYRSSGGRGDMRRFAKKLRKKTRNRCAIFGGIFCRNTVRNVFLAAMCRHKNARERTFPYRRRCRIH